jgi:sec-independent protein translocase protein TatA
VKPLYNELFAVLAATGVILMRLGLPELVVILVIIIVIFGATRLPELGRGIGKGIKNFREATKEGVNDKDSN